MKTNLTIMILTAGMVAIPGGWTAFGQTVLGGNGLPTLNINSGTSTQGNVAWADAESSATPANYWDPGASFTVGTSGTVTDIRVWDVNGPTTGLSLLGANGSILSSSYTVTSTTYANGQTYQGQTGDFLPLYQVDFAVDLSMTAGQSLDVFLNGSYVPYSDDGYVGPFLAASAAPAGTPFLWLDIGDPSLDGVPTVQTSDTGAPGGGWDQSSVGDVEALGTVPDGGSAFMLLGSSLAGLAWLGRRFGRG